jgi:hypothetical protein
VSEMLAATDLYRDNLDLDFLPWAKVRAAGRPGGRVAACRGALPGCRGQRSDLAPQGYTQEDLRATANKASEAKPDTAFLMVRSPAARWARRRACSSAAGVQQQR